MRHRRRAIAAFVGLALAAAGVLDFGARAQTAEACVAVNDRDEMTVQVGNPTADTTFTNPSVTLEVQVTNTSTRKTLPTEPDPAVTRITARLLSCRDGQVLPDETTRSTPTGQTADSLALSWAIEPIPTNGPFAIEIVATGNRSGSPAQDSRVVVPFSLAVAPKRPSGVKATTTSSGVSVSWSNADREPDLLLYQVKRASQGSSDFRPIAAGEEGAVPATTNTVSDDPGPGAWRYHVVAIRAGATSSAGVPSPASSVATVEVAAPPPPPPGGSTATTSGSSGGSTATTSGSGSGGSSGSTASGTSASDTTVRPGAPATSTVDLSNFAATLNAQRQTPPRRIEPPDPGFLPTLPFVPRQAVPAPVTDDGLATDVAEPEELGLEEPNQGVGQRVILDEGDRRRSLGFVSFALLLFVLGMTGLFLRSEVRRADDLELLVPIAPLDPAPASAPTRAPTPESEGFADLADPAPVAAATIAGSVAGAAVPRRARRTAAPSVAPSLDIPEPAATPATRAPNRSRTPANARRTPTRLPPRPADDRREGDPAVRPRRRRTGEGNRRLPVG